MQNIVLIFFENLTFDLVLLLLLDIEKIYKLIMFNYFDFLLNKKSIFVKKKWLF